MMTPLFEHRREVRFQDVDAAGIVFFARVFEYFHDAYFALLAAHGLDMPRLLREGAWGAPIGHVEADFKAPMRFGEKIVVGIDRGEIGRTSLTVDYRVTGEREKLYCTGKIVSVFIDRATFRLCEVPSEVRAIFTASVPPA
jgi:YbgC/YbaW family acyl-CoA thioester hydrolase